MVSESCEETSLLWHVGVSLLLCNRLFSALWKPVFDVWLSGELEVSIPPSFSMYESIPSQWVSPGYVSICVFVMMRTMESVEPRGMVLVSISSVGVRLCNRELTTHTREMTYSMCCGDDHIHTVLSLHHELRYK